MAGRSAPAACLLAALLGAGCSPGSGEPAGSPQADAPVATGGAVRPEYDRQGKLQKLEFDRNGDGKMDTWGYMDGSRVVRVEADENGDGEIDRWEYYRTELPPAKPGEPPPGPDRLVERIERATKLDGRVTRTDYFADGELARSEEDTDGNGKVDKWTTYADGSLSMLATDTSGRGTPDRRMVYRADGTLDRVEVDATGSGEFRTVPPKP